MARDCRTRLFLIDDIHFFEGRKRDEQEINDHLKNLASLIDATFVFAGIDCATSGFPDEGRSPVGRQKSQARRRITPHQLRPFAVTTPAGTADWPRCCTASKSACC